MRTTSTSMRSRALKRALALQRSGLASKKQLARAREWLCVAAACGSTPAIYNLGLYFLEGVGGRRDHVIAKAYLELAARSGSSDAAYELGIAIVQRRLRWLPVSRGLWWLRFAARLGDAGAAYVIGDYYLRTHRASSGFRWLNRASELGNLDAMTLLGECWLTGKGVTKNREKAKTFFQRAARRGSIKASRLLRSVGK